MPLKLFKSRSWSAKYDNLLHTVNSEIFTRVLFSRKFRENKILAKSLCHLLMKVNHAIVAIFSIANMSFNTIRENIILAKISEFTVSVFTTNFMKILLLCTDKDLYDIHQIKTYMMFILAVSMLCQNVCQNLYVKHLVLSFVRTHRHVKMHFSVKKEGTLKQV